MQKRQLTLARGTSCQARSIGTKR